MNRHEYNHRPVQRSRAGAILYNIVISALIVGAAVYGARWVRDNRPELQRTAVEQIQSVVDSSSAPARQNEQTYPIPVQVLPIIQRVGIDQAIASRLQITITPDASQCTGSNSDAGDAEAAACFLSPNTIIFPQSLLAKSKIEQNYIFSHEYMHYIWTTMSQADKDALTPYILQVYNANSRYLNSRLSGYNFPDEETRLSELHSYIGTELADSVIPALLLNHYKQYLPNRSALPSFSPAQRNTSAPPVYRLQVN